MGRHELGGRAVVVAVAPRAADRGLAPLVGGVGAGASEVVDLALAGAASPATLIDQLSDHDKTTVFGPGPDDHARGTRSIARSWTRKRRAPPPFRFVGEVRAP